jgi:signal transduction histidine kinase
MTGRPGRHRWTIRVRLTLLYGGLVLLAGASLLVTLLVILDRVIENQPIVLDSGIIERLTAAPAEPGGPVDETTQRQAKLDAEAATERVRAELRQRTLVPLIGRGLAGLGVLGACGFLVGWFVAGRSLRPVQRITATAQTVAAGDLDRRIALTGPRDELRELADTFDAMMDRLEAAFDQQRAFIGNASHELKTPIAINRTLLDVAVTDPDAPRQVIELVDALQEVNARQQRIVEALLTLARSDAGLPESRTIDLAG